MSDRRAWIWLPPCRQLCTYRAWSVICCTPPGLWQLWTVVMEREDEKIHSTISCNSVLFLHAFSLDWLLAVLFFPGDIQVLSCSGSLQPRPLREPVAPKKKERFGFAFFSEEFTIPSSPSCYPFRLTTSHHNPPTPHRAMIPCALYCIRESRRGRPSRKSLSPSRISGEEREEDLRGGI